MNAYQRTPSFQPVSSHVSHEYRDQTTPKHPFSRRATMDNAMFQLSSLGLGEQHNQSLNAMEVSSQDIDMASPYSDRSVEPMMVSDISNCDIDGDGDISLPVRSKLTAKLLDDNDNQSVHSSQGSTTSGLSWFWSIGQKPSDPDTQTLADDNLSCISGMKPVNSQTIADDNLSCISGMTGSTLSCATDFTGSTNNTLTHRRPLSEFGGTYTESVVSSEQDNRTDLSSQSMKHVQLKAAAAKKHGCCGWCPVIVHSVIIGAIIATLVIFGSRDLKAAICTNNLTLNMTLLENDLEDNVFGQHIAVHSVLETLNDLLTDNGKNVTVLSFHGWTGIGKNYISSFVARQLHDDYVHKIIIPLEFAHGRDSSHHREQMVSRILINVRSCGVTLFIIDEVDKASRESIAGIHDALRNLTNSVLENTKVAVILLSNSGGSAINRYFLDELISGKHRESVNRDHILAFMLKVDDAQINHEWHISLLRDGLIDAIVPFLPLEKSHVRQCAEKYITASRPMLRAGDIEGIIDRVVEQMTFFPRGIELFSSTGCRGVALKVDLTID